MHPPIPLPVCFCLSIDAWQASSITMCVQECSSRRRRKITAGLEGRGLCSWYSCSSIPPRQMPRVYECTGETSECVCVPEHSEREREWGRGTKNETVWEHATISCSNVKQWKRDRERERASSWPSCFKMSSAFVYIEENAPTFGQIAQKGASLYLCLLLVSLFFFTRLVPFSSSLSRPLSPSNSVCFSIFAIAAPSVQLPLAFSRCSQYLSLFLFVSSFFCIRAPWERERERGDTGEHLPTIYFL